MDQTSEIGSTLLFVLCGALGMLLLAIAIIVFFIIYQKRLFAQQEDIQKMEIEYQKKLLKHSVKTQEEERKRIASDLHDEVGSILSVTKIYAHQINPNQTPQNFEEHKQKISELIDNAVNRLRNISHNLFPPNLDHLGFFQATVDFCKKIENVNNIDVHLSHNRVPQLNKQKELIVYRILQELVQNTLKHANATRIQIELTDSAQGFKLDYKDNGIGFSTPINKSKLNGLGIMSIESRANSIGAKISIKSQHGQGVHFELWV